MKNFSIEYLTSKDSREKPRNQETYQNQFKEKMNNSLDSSWSSSSSNNSPLASPSSLVSYTQGLNTDYFLGHGMNGINSYIKENFARLPNLQTPETPKSRKAEMSVNHHKQGLKDTAGVSEKTRDQNDFLRVREVDSKEQIRASSAPAKSKPAHSYIALISKAILDSRDKKLILADIYEYITTKFPYYNNQDKAWRNSIRHNLSLNECFIKSGRSENGKGNYWSIHPACVEDFSKGDFRRRQARRRARRTLTQLSDNTMVCGGNIGYVPMTASALPQQIVAPTTPGLPMMSSALTQVGNYLPQQGMPPSTIPEISYLSEQPMSQIGLSQNSLPQAPVTSAHMLSGHSSGSPYFSFVNSMTRFINHPPMMPNHLQSW